MGFRKEDWSIHVKDHVFLELYSEDVRHLLVGVLVCENSIHLRDLG
jgi:hypothetical protein